MPNQTEPNANNALGDLLRAMMPGSWVLSENTQTFPAHPGQHADVLITAPGRSPVVVEAEYEPAPEVEQDAADRLDLAVAGESRSIEAAIALRYPAPVRDAYDLAQAVADARLSYCVLYEDGSRFPESGWLEGSVTDLADLVRLVSVPQKEVDRAVDTLQDGIERAAVILDELKDMAPATAREIARLLGMSDVPQTRRMACAIMANALVFHERIAGKHEGVKPLNLVCGPEVANPQAETLAAWAAILKINYWPIFAIARDIMGQLDSGHASQVLAVLRDTAQQVQSAGVTHAHDLTGRIFQRLIADRKYLATFYTRPESAALLARLAVAKLEGVDWADSGAIGRLRIADSGYVRQIEDGPYGGTAVSVGDEISGEMITAEIGEEGDSWAAVRLSDYSVAQTAHLLSQSRLWLPGDPKASELRMESLDSIGKRGWYRINIAGSTGPFTKAPPNPTATYPSLWNHDSKNETLMICEPDSQLVVKPGLEEKASAVWASSSRSHLNLDFRYTSQPMAVVFTERESVGGRAWPNVIFGDKRFDFAFTV